MVQEFGTPREGFNAEDAESTEGAERRNPGPTLKKRGWGTRRGMGSCALAKIIYELASRLRIPCDGSRWRLGLVDPAKPF